MASIITKVLLVCCFYTVFGAYMYNQDETQKASQDIRHVRATVNIVPTFDTEYDGLNLQRKGNPVFIDTMNASDALFPSHVYDKTFEDMMAIIFSHSKDKWEHMRDHIQNKLSGVNSKAAYYVRVSKSIRTFYENIIRLYTKRIVFEDVNLMLRDYRRRSESGLGPYALMLNVVLSQWESLKSYTETTYRGVNFDITEYTVGTTFTWTAFTSSSSNMTVACNWTRSVLFIFDNSEVSDWRPRGIEHISEFRNEYEYLYPATAIFKITDRPTGPCTNTKGEMYDVTKVYLRLKRGITLNGDVNLAAIIEGSAGGVAVLAIVECVVVGVLLT